MKQILFSESIPNFLLYECFAMHMMTCQVLVLGPNTRGVTPGRLACTRVPLWATSLSFWAAPFSPRGSRQRVSPAQHPGRHRTRLTPLFPFYPPPSSDALGPPVRRSFFLAVLNPDSFAGVHVWLHDALPSVACAIRCPASYKPIHTLRHLPTPPSSACSHLCPSELVSPSAIAS